ncbi:DUF924 family protein [Metapseudomonas otitidis]|uniref:DUF924 family protein n=1 Tax=Metapseudomonas otitidis TaxID=319939 RepID=UPI003CE7EE9B
MQPWQPLLEWWFGPEAPASEVVANRQGLWFGKRDNQDREAGEHFGLLVEQALAGGLADWGLCPDGWLARLLLLDQLPRMIFRDQPRAFAGDALAREQVRDGLAQAWDRQLPPIRRVFAYLVLEHAEDLALQDEAVQRFAALRDALPEAERGPFDSYLDYAERHRAVIARFGRFPHRNAILSRASTEAELRFLEEPGSRF